MSQDRSALDARAYAVMLRSILACALLLAWARLRGIALFGRDGTVNLRR